MIELMIKSSLVIGIIYVIYVSLYKRSTFFTLNRFVVIGSILLSLLLPLISIPEVNRISGAVLLPAFTTGVESVSQTVAPVNILKSIVAMIFYAGILISLSMLIYRLFRLKSFLNRIDFEQRRGINIGRFDGDLTSFSFFNFICINNKEWENAEEIIDHEMHHIRAFHSIDNILFELFKCVQWFNPAVYLLHNEIRNLHEFEVDAKVLQQEEADEYTERLTGGLIPQKEFQLTNPYKSNSNLLKRIKMIYKNRTSSYFKIVYTAILPALIIAFAVISCNNESQMEEDLLQSTPQETETALIDEEVLTGEELKEVDKMAEFPGGAQAMYAYLGENINYPEEAKEEGLSGKVYVRFVVASNGKINKAEVIKGIHPLLDDTALEVIKKMPDWIPAEKDGKKVAVEFMLPISFQLR